MNHPKQIVQLLLSLLFIGSINLIHASTLDEFLRGEREKFNTKNHPKAKGLDMTISFPKSWIAQEGERPNVVQKFLGENDFAVVTLTTAKLPIPAGEPLTKVEMEEMFSPAELKDYVPPGGTFVKAETTTIENLPTGMLEYSLSQSRAGTTVNLQGLIFVFIAGDIMVQIQGQVGVEPNSGISATQQMAKIKPLFMQMANSVVLNSAYRKQ